MEKVNPMPKRANLQGDQIVTCIELMVCYLRRYGMVQLQACGHPKAHQKKSRLPQQHRADLQTSPKLTITNSPTSILQ
jgi:hypothetical protein